jgi:demethylmenaquinone methyltransferase/2-methoxy-6-polyprenyl-1,4-benzoquinol methylase
VISIIVIVGQEARAERIRAMFDQVAPRYDVRNSMFSLARDGAWRRRAARLTRLQPGQTALDLCTGTGRLAHELVPMVRPGGRVIGVDFSPGMLELARRREPEVEFRQGDVSHLLEADASVDAVTIGFGLRNLVNRDAALREMLRVLRPGGRLVVLEFAPPTGPLLAGYRFYLGRVMPAVAGLFNAGEANAYRYLAETVAGFPQPAELARDLEGIGFEVTVQRMTLGIVALHVAVRRD